MSNTPVWFISGASSGFGLEMAKLALSKGHTVVAAARNTDRMNVLRDAGAHIITLDVTWPLSQLQEVAAAVFTKHGRVDYLVNAAGYVFDGTVEEASPEEIFACINTNVLGTINVTKAFLPGLRAQPIAESGTRATVATFGSVGSWNGAASCGIYAMTKACTSSIGETLYLELAPFDIVGTVIEPGYFRTSLLSSGVVSRSAERLTVYDDLATPAGKMRKALQDVNGKQPGDVVKGSAIAFQVLTRTGVANGKQVPVRIILGPDCDDSIRKKVSSTLGILDDWKDAIRSTNHEDSE